MKTVNKKPSGCLLALAIALIVIGLPLVCFALYGAFQTIDDYMNQSQLIEIWENEWKAESDSLVALQDSVINVLTAEAKPQMDETLQRGDTTLYDQLDADLNEKIENTIDSLDLNVPAYKYGDPVISIITGAFLAIVIGIAGMLPLVFGIVFLVYYLIQQKKYNSDRQGSGHF